MFKFLKKEVKAIPVYAMVSGKVKVLENVPDEVFAKGLVGPGIAIVPDNSCIVSPIKGKVTMVFPTGHAIGITRSDGVEFLIHVGIDTVSMKGDGFQVLVQEQQMVEVGVPLINADLQRIEETGLATDTLCIVTNPKDGIEFEVEKKQEEKVQAGIDVLFNIKVNT